MPNDDEELFNFEGGADMRDFFRKAMETGEMPAGEVIDFLTAEPYDLTTHFHAVLYAIEAEHLVQYFRKVECRVGGKSIGIGMEVRSDFEPKLASEEDKVLIAQAITAILRSGGLPVVRKGKRVFVHGDDCDGNCGIEHGEVDPFGEQVAAFRAEIDQTLGTDSRPPEEGWDRWMGGR